MRIRVENPVVEILGDEMARVMWEWIRERLIDPHLDIPFETYDLSILERDATDDAVTCRAAEAVVRHGVGVKCATITADERRREEFGLRDTWPSPNATIRSLVGGTLFRAPIVVRNVPRLVRTWKRPIVIARHAFGDQYAARELRIPGPGTLTLVYEDTAGNREAHPVHAFSGPGVALGMFNTDASIRGFACAVFEYALLHHLPVYLSTKTTILKTYDRRFVDQFAECYEEGGYAARFAASGLTYQHRLIDDMVAFALKSEGGFLWACKNYDGDVQSDSLAQGFGSLGLMTSELLSADGRVLLAEAAHGTVTAHFRRHQAGEKTSTNPVASIFAWTRGLGHRARMDGNDALAAFCRDLEAACVETVESDQMTKDLAVAAGRDTYLTTEAFLDAVAATLAARRAAA